ncbi:hypothetical protein H9P43_008185 [Blastocladiella emersonii ATCC 22665]|nr:hypothetical protein H9P43_008185 [Blastocladiella emersonii ATCC 22665]
MTTLGHRLKTLGKHTLALPHGSGSYHVIFETDGEFVPAAADVKLVVRVLYEGYHHATSAFYSGRTPCYNDHNTATCKNKVAAAEFMAECNKTVPVSPCDCPPDIESQTLREARDAKSEVAFAVVVAGLLKRTRELPKEYAKGQSRRSALFG